MAALAFLASVLLQEDPEGVAFYESKIRPLLVEKCHACHGPKAEKLKGGLRVDSRDSLLKGGDTSPAVVPGKPEESLLLRAMRHADPDLKMPPKEKLPERAIADVEAWIRRGAPMTKDAGAPAGSDFWAFRAPREKPLPDAAAIDRYVRAKLEEKGLRPAPPADPATLLRRVTLDLTGLPPTLEDLDAFLADPSDAAYGKAVDRLLASPAYGERWARHWLDVARFTETNGFEFNKMRPNAWPYRDWVIAALNRDVPYDRFVRLQIAGDAIDGAGAEGAIAAGFLMCGPWDEVGYTQQSLVMRARVREEDLEDVIATVSQAFLGLTVNCARCHNHKFAPIPQAEYYRFKSVFEGVRPGERSVASPEEIRAAEARREEAERRVRGAESDLSRFTDSIRARIPRPARAGPAPLARWTFDDGARDVAGTLHGELVDGATVSGGRLRLDGKGAHVRTAPLGRELREKTLEAWVALVPRKQAGGGVITVETRDGREFDAIVFAEREPNKWMAGSDFFRRTRDLSGPAESSSDLVHVAATYGADGSIAFYRNGVPYGELYRPKDGGVAFPAGTSRVLLGLRHTGGGRAALSGEIEEAALYDRALSGAEVAAAYAGSPHRASEEEVEAAATAEERSRRDALRKALEQARRDVSSLPALKSAYVGTRVQPPATHRLLRGDVEKPAEVVSGGGLAVLGRAEWGLAPDAPEAERRRRFADWVADPANPLTARVIVNRVWRLHFGRGIVGTPNDLGPTGERPTHPELLDALALRFVEDGWSLKTLHRLIVSSATYRQSSRLDPAAAAVDADDRLLGRFPPRRLEAEAVRDAMLAVSGRLIGKAGGPSDRPFDTHSLANSLYFTPKDGPEFDRRTLYRFNAVSGKDALLEAFDAPDPGIRTPDRRATITPQQALVLLNDPFVHRQAAAFAERVKDGDVGTSVRRAYRLALGREPDAAERARSEAVAREHGLKVVCWALFNASEFLHVR